jgi:threonine dehydrogenase-like Zn-dependent dehydrogenase
VHGIFGYTHMLGGYAGGQAEYARVPFADVGPIKVEDDLADEQVLFLSDIFPTGLGAYVNKGLTMRTGQCHVHRYLQPLLDHIRRGDIDPSFVVTHRLPLDEAPNGYETFKHKEDACVKVVLKP